MISSYSSILRQPPFYLIAMCVSISGWAQKYALPFECEQYQAAYYDSLLSSYDKTFSSEEEALTYYYVAYKKQRSTHSTEYFVSADQSREIAKAYLQKHSNAGAGMSLVNFLESGGSESALQQLLQTDHMMPLLLPYIYLAAFMQQDEVRKNESLQAMMDYGMISEIMMAFGLNALSSAKEKDIIVTQSLHDLLAVQAAQYTKKTFPVFNIFASTCEGFDPDLGENLTGRDASAYWYSSTISPSLAENSENHFEVLGTGFQLLSKDAKGADPQGKLLTDVARNIRGLTVSSKTPADQELIASYRFFSEALAEKAKNNSDPKLKSTSEDIKRWLQKNAILHELNTPVEN